MFEVSRRQLLIASAPLALTLAGLGRARAANDALDEQLGPPSPFDFDRLRTMAQELAARPYVPPQPPVPDTVREITYDVIWKIRFLPERGLWRDGPGPFPVRLFHLDKFNALPVRLNVVRKGMARGISYSPALFDYRNAPPDLVKKLPPDLGFSGFRVMNAAGTIHQESDWLAFQGASYFRTSGADNQYGASARGIAVNTAASTKEEFPRFTEFWLAEGAPNEPSITVYALLDGPSLTGAYRFVATRTAGAVMDVDAELFVRNDVAQLGVAPLTSMFWFGENERRRAADWRPEIHDSDGLELWTGQGERIWRPLINPPAVQTNSFLDENPKGFGLMQRDRAFAHYEDDSAFYNRRSSIWVEPKGDWGKGAVQLVEIPTDDEIHDNIVAFWKSDRAVKAGDRVAFGYRLYWQDDNPHPPADLGRVLTTRIGRGGRPGQRSPDDKNKWKFVIDFAGGALNQLARRYDLTPDVSISRGKVENAVVIKVADSNQWRAVFDVNAPGKEQIDLRCVLRLNGKPLTEAWVYQYFPPA